MLRPKDLCQGSGTRTFLEAMQSGKVHLARFVLDALDGRIINSKMENGRTPLMFAVCLPEPGARIKFTRLLLEKGANVNCKDDQGRTALSLACELGYLDTVKVLVQFNADPEISDSWGNSALMYAAYAGHSQVLDFLVRAFKRLGLKLDHTNRAGHSAIQVANIFGHNQCVQSLNVPGKRCVGPEELFQDFPPGKVDRGGLRPPNRLSKQVLETFTKQIHSRSDHHLLPAVFQRQLRVGGSPVRKCKGHPQSPDRTGQPPQWLPGKDTQDGAKQIQISKPKDLRGAEKSLGHNPELTKADKIKDRVAQPPMPEPPPAWGKSRSFNLEFLTRRKQSYQGDMSDRSQSAVRLKRGSLPDEKPLIAKVQCQENTKLKKDDSDKRGMVSNAVPKGKRRSQEPAEDGTVVYTDRKDGSVVSGRREFQQGRQDKLLCHRQEMAPQRIQVCPPGFKGLGTRLLRRFTAPEFMRLAVDFPSGSENGKGKISRSETFPLSHAHQKVNNQPSVDSISAVKCEFENSVHSDTLRRKPHS